MRNITDVPINCKSDNKLDIEDYQYTMQISNSN